MSLGISTLLLPCLGSVDIQVVLLTVIKQAWISQPLSRLSTVETIEVQPTSPYLGMAAAFMMLSAKQFSNGLDTPHKPEESILMSSGWKTNRQLSRQARSYCTAGLRATPSSLAARITKCGSRKNSRAREMMSAFPSTNTKFACFAVVISPTAPT